MIIAELECLCIFFHSNFSALTERLLSGFLPIDPVWSPISPYQKSIKLEMPFKSFAEKNILDDRKSVNYENKHCKFRFYFYFFRL